MEKKEEERNCHNCVHYLAYYIKVDGRFRKLTMGHCSNKMPFGSFRKTDSACEFYEEKAESKQNSMRVVKNLADICERLDALVQTLESE